MFARHRETILAALAFTFLILVFNGCAILTQEQKQHMSPVDTVRLFDRTYGSASMNRSADIITKKMRDGLPKCVWVYDRWKTMNEIEYKRLKSEILQVKKKDDKAVVCMNSTISAGGSEANQKEIYTLVNRNGTWLIDNLKVTDEKLDSREMTL